MPNVDTVTEMVDLIDAQRAYEANVTAMSGRQADVRQDPGDPPLMPIDPIIAVGGAEWQIGPIDGAERPTSATPGRRFGGMLGDVAPVAPGHADRRRRRRRRTSPPARPPTRPRS